MSEVMQQGILRMPPECWMNGEPLDERQRYSAYVAAADRILELEDENAALREELGDVKRVRYSLEDSLDHAHAQAEACLRDKAVLGGKRKVYRICFDWIGPDTGTHYFKVQRLGLFGIWWTVGRSLKLEAAKGLILTLIDIDEKEAKP